MNLKQCLLTKNECYIQGRNLVLEGLMIHSTGANNPYLKRYVPNYDGTLGDNKYNNHWNQFRPDERQVCVHGFIGKLADETIATIQTLPWDMRGWHAGKQYGNDHFIGVEICEDDLTNSEYFNKVYKEAVELFAMLCKNYNLNPLTQIICHAEGYQKGIASNHGDVIYWFSKHNKTMNDFRNDVNNIINNVEIVNSKTDEISKSTSTVNEGIKSIQKTLNSRYNLDIKVDNIYGKETKKALVKGLQTELKKQFGKSLVIDGIFGNKTKDACITLKNGASGNITYILQAILYCKGYTSNGLDGIFGKNTENDVIKFQSDNKLTIDGIAGKNTFSKLFA